MPLSWPQATHTVERFQPDCLGVRWESADHRAQARTPITIGKASRSNSTISIAIRRAFTLAFKTDIKDSRDEHELHEGSCRSRVRVEIRSRRAPRHRVMSRSQRYAAIMPESPSSATSHSLRVGYGRITNARENTAALPIMAAQTRFSLASGVGFLLHRETAALTTNSITRAPAPISDSLSLALSTSARPEPRERLGFF
jgi:stress-induced morphogen